MTNHSNSAPEEDDDALMKESAQELAKELGWDNLPASEEIAQMASPMPTTAIFSEDQVYRYTLSRVTSVKDGGTVLFIMLNPSTATAEEDDPTIRRCYKFAQDWGYTHLLVGNLFAYRATDPKEFQMVNDPVGPDNDQHLLAMARAADLIICAWGQMGESRRRGWKVLWVLNRMNKRREGYHLQIPIRHLGLTKNGQPKHPLYLKKTVERMEF